MAAASRTKMLPPPQMRLAYVLFMSSSSIKRPLRQATLFARPEKKAKPSSWKVFCDLDGVLVDFDKGTEGLEGRNMWIHIGRHESFWLDLEWTTDGRELWDEIKVLQPNILTGIAPSCKAKAVPQKIEWCQRELGVEVHGIDSTKVRQSLRSNVTNVVCCYSKNKHLESGAGRYEERDSRFRLPHSPLCTGYSSMTATSSEGHGRVREAHLFITRRRRPRWRSSGNWAFSRRKRPRRTPSSRGECCESVPLSSVPRSETSE